MAHTVCLLPERTTYVLVYSHLRRSFHKFPIGRLLGWFCWNASFETQLCWTYIWIHTKGWIIYHMFNLCSTGMTSPPTTFIIYGLHVVSTGRLPFATHEMKICTTFVLWSDNIDGVKTIAIPSTNLIKAVIIFLLSIRKHKLVDITVVMQCSTSLDYENRFSWRLGMEMKSTVLHITGIITVSTSILPLHLDVTVIPLASFSFTLSTSIIAWNSPMSDITCCNAPP